MFIPPILPPSQEAAKAESEYRRQQAGPGDLSDDIRWAFALATFPLRAFVSWRRKRRQRRNAWAHGRRPDAGRRRQ